MTLNIQLTADEVRRLIAYTDDCRDAFCPDGIMAAYLQVEDDDWDEITAGNDFRIDKPDYGINEVWGPFQIWDVTLEMYDAVKTFLDTYPTVESVINNYLNK